MGREKIVAIVGHGILGSSIARQLEKIGNEVEIISPEQAYERGITFNEPEPIEFKAPELIEQESSRMFKRPLTRRERRAKERKNKNGC